MGLENFGKYLRGFSEGYILGWASHEPLPFKCEQAATGSTLSWIMVEVPNNPDKTTSAAAPPNTWKSKPTDQTAV